MQLLIPLSLVLIIFSLLGSLAIFLAKILTFLCMEAFFDIYDNSGMWTAYLTLMAIIALFSCIALTLIKRSIDKITKKIEDPAKTLETKSQTFKSDIIQIILCETLKFFLAKKSK